MLDFDEGQLTVKLRNARTIDNANQVLLAVYEATTTLKALGGQLVNKVNQHTKVIKAANNLTISTSRGLTDTTFFYQPRKAMDYKRNGRSSRSQRH